MDKSPFLSSVPPPPQYEATDPGPIPFYGGQARYIPPPPLEPNANDEIPIARVLHNQRKSLDNKFAISIILIGIGVLLTGSLLILCAIPSCICLYKAYKTEDPQQKKSLGNLGLCNSIAYLIFSSILLLAVIIVVAVAASQ